MSTGNRKDEITKQLMIAFEEAGRILTEEEVRKKDTLPNPDTYAYHYGSYAEAARYAWRRVNPPEEGQIRLTPMAIAFLKKKEEKEKKDS